MLLFIRKTFRKGALLPLGAIIGPGCKLGFGNYMESSADLSHDNEMGDFIMSQSMPFSEIFPKLKIIAFLGLHSTVKDGITIASNNLIGSAANV